MKKYLYNIIDVEIQVLHGSAWEPNACMVNKWMMNITKRFPIKYTTYIPPTPFLHSQYTFTM